MSRTRTRLQAPERANVMEIRAELMDTYHYDRDGADDVLFYTADHWRTNGHKASEWKVPDADGFITVRYYGLSRFSIEDHREFPRKRLAISRPTGYNRMDKGLPSKGQEKGRTYMPPARGRRAATAPAPPAEPASNGEVDFQRYLDKDISPTMQDYVTWFEDNVGSLDDIPVDKILVLGVTVYSHFQKSDFNQDRREERRASRASTRPAPEPEPEPAKPAAKGRGGRRAAAPAPEPEPEPAPARRGRGRATRAGAEAPY